MREWTSEYERQMEPVFRAWTEIGQAVGKGRLDRLPELCDGFAAGLQALDRSRLLQVPDPVLRLHLSRALSYLGGARRRCLQQRVFDMVYHLSLAREALVTVRQRQRRFE